MKLRTETKLTKQPTKQRVKEASKIPKELIGTQQIPSLKLTAKAHESIK